MTRTAYNPGGEQGPRYGKGKKTGKKSNGSGGGANGNPGGFPSNVGGGGGGRGLPRGLRNQRYGAYGGYGGVRYGDALSLVNAQLKPQLNEVRNELQKTRRETQLERQRARNQYGAAVGDLEHIFGESGDYIDYQNQQIQQNYGALTDRAQQAQAALLDHLQATGAANAGEANSELARLGIQGSGDMGEFAADQSNIEQLAQVTGANNLANISAAQSNAGDVGNLLLGMNAGSKSAAMGSAVKQRGEAMFEAEANKKVAFEQLRRTMKDLRMSRPDLVRQMLEQLRQSGWSQYVDAANMSLQREQLDLQRQQMRQYNRNYGGGSSYSGGGYYGSSGGGSDSATANGDSAVANEDASMNTYNQLVMDILGGKKPGKKPKKK